MWSEQRENDAALGAIDRLQAAGARHIHAMRIALNTNLQSGRWDEALKALRVLEKRSALHSVLARRLKLMIYGEQLQAQRFDPSSLEIAWNAIPAADRAMPELALEGARLLIVAGPGGLAAGIIEQALEQPCNEWDETCLRLLDEFLRFYNQPDRRQQFAESGHHPRAGNP